MDEKYIEEEGKNRQVGDRNNIVIFWIIKVLLDK